MLPRFRTRKIYDGYRYRIGFLRLLVVSEPVSEKFGTGKSFGTGIAKKWYRKMSRNRYRNKLVLNKYRYLYCIYLVPERVLLSILFHIFGSVTLCFLQNIANKTSHMHANDKAIETSKVRANISKYLQLYQDRLFKSLDHNLFGNIQISLTNDCCLKVSYIVTWQFLGKGWHNQNICNFIQV